MYVTIIDCNLPGTFSADASVTDVSGKSPLDYATEKGLHYCALLLTKAEVLGPTDRSEHFSAA